MPIGTWKNLAGKRCKCGNYATHYRDEPICCDCHGGQRINQNEAKIEHERILLREDDAFHKELSSKLNKMKKSGDLF